jgi:hypothetical protein
MSYTFLFHYDKKLPLFIISGSLSLLVCWQQTFSDFKRTPEGPGYGQRSHARMPRRKEDSPHRA